MSDSRPVRVLHLIDGLGGGGCERWLWDIVRLSSPEKFEHHVVSTHRDPGDYVYADRLRLHGVYRQAASPRLLGYFWKKSQPPPRGKRLSLARRVLRVFWRLGSYVLTGWDLFRALLRFRPDVVHAHTYHVSFVAGLLLKAIMDKPLIYTVPASILQMRNTDLSSMPRFYSRLHRRVDTFFTGASYSELISLGIPASKIVFVHAGTDLETVSAGRKERERHQKEIRRSLGLAGDTRIALSVGRLHSSKGHLFALESLPELIRQIPDLHWVVLGEGTQRGELETRARELDVAEHVHLIGFKPDPLPYYAAADIYLRTPVFEADNLSSYQAAAMGLPAVGFDTGRESELMTEAGYGILVANRDGAAFGNAVASILLSDDGGRAMGERGAEYSGQHLGIEHATSPFYAAYVALGRQGEVANSGQVSAE